MSGGVCDVLLLSDEMKDFEFDVDEAEIAKTNDDDSDIRDLAHKLFSFFFPTIYEKYKKVERTLAIIRPQLLELQKVEILEEIANARFTVGRQKEITLNERQVTAFYSLSEKNDLPPEFVEYMISGPILVLALFRDNAIKHWRNLLGPDDVEQAKQDYPSSLIARFAYKDNPFNQLHGSQDIETAVKELQFFFPVEHTLVAIKPDTVRHNKDIIIAKIHEGSFIISAIKSVVMSQEIAAEFYKDYEEEPFFNQLIENVSQSPLMAIILTKENAVKEWKELMGPADLELAKTSFPNSLRAELDSSILKNGLHSTSSAKHAKDYIKKFFGDALLDSFGVVLDEGLTISSTALLSDSPSSTPSTTAIEPSEFVDTEAPTDEQEVNISDSKTASETQDTSVPDEFADSNTINASATIEDLDSGTRDVNVLGEDSVISTSDIPAPVEISDIGIENVASPAQVPDTGTADGATLAEVPETSTQELIVPEEVPNLHIPDVSTFVEDPDSTTYDVSVSSEAPNASNSPGDIPDSTTEDISIPNDSTKDVSIPGEASDSTVQNIPPPSEDPKADTQNVFAPGEVPDSTVESVSAQDTVSGDKSIPIEASDANEGGTSAPMNSLDADNEDVSAAIESADASNEGFPAPTEVSVVDDNEATSGPINVLT
ncbi:thioredoxin domain-containing protein 6-like [Hypanus sabinus]|uniref:thioredoxin domain-containing protein 6-like n=1 Tax=Hypanus sabinus TaxID=79690 RepID=UPI0028C48FFB|nr:thioredoxin domain-containing protein 6-like [Hypanus sabinus]